jgi:DNA-binding MarR family transcriptional regulator
MGDATSSPSDPPLTDADYRDQADFRCALRKFLRFSEEQARAEGITPQQHLLLVIVRGHRSAPDISIGEAAEAMQLRHSSTSLLIDRCVKRGLLQRRDDPSDRRKVTVRLTPVGEDVLERITRANRRQLGALEGDLFRDSFREALRASGQSQP